MLMLAEWEGKREIETISTGKEFTPDEIRSAILSFLEKLPKTPASMGVAIPGLVEGDNKVSVCDVVPNIDGMEADFLRVGEAPVYFINDAEAALVEESAELNDSATAVIIMVGTGVGMAFKMNGVMARGAKGWAGELGKIPIATVDGVKVLDDLASGASIVERLGGDMEKIRQRIEESDEKALECFKQAGSAFGLGLATTISIINPELVVLGGGTLNYPGYYETALESARDNLFFSEMFDQCTIRKPKEEKFVVALGALRFAKHY